MLGCNPDGDLDASAYSKPLPWIGLYIAVASLFCALAMLCDVVSGFRHRKLWFPSKFFPLNATTLTMLAVATKLPVDLNTPMPRPQDQLTKLSGTVLLCTVMGNLMPSLGSMDDSDITSNVIALGILVITVIVNICIQIGTGVIFVFLPEQALIMFFMLVLLLIMFSSALTVPIIKRLLDQQYDRKYMELRDLDERPADGEDMHSFERMKKFVKRYWLMAHSSSPQYVLGRSAPCTASGAFCLLSALILVEASVRSFWGKSLRFCSGNSDYGWSTIDVFVAQAAMVLVGTIAPAYRWFNVVDSRTKGERWRWWEGFKVESYWTQRLKDWREAPSPCQVGSRQSRRIAHNLKNLILDGLIIVQIGVVLLSKLVQLSSILPVCWIKRSTRLLNRLKFSPSTSNGEGGDLREYALHLEGEDDLADLIMRNGRKDTEQCIRKGTKNQPANLIELIEKYSTLSKGFTGVSRFDSERVLSIFVEEPPNCWALTIVTLASIVVSLPRIDHRLIDSLLMGVSEGLRYIKLVEKHLDRKGLLKMREVADIVWLGVDLYDRWFDVDLHSLALEHENGKNIIEKLGVIGKNWVEEHQKMETGHGKGKYPLEWPAKVLAGNCMYKTSQTILLNYEDIYGADNKLFLWLQSTISDMLGACLTNLPRIIDMECFCNAIEAREESVRNAAFLLGEAEKIMKMLGDPKNACMYPKATEYIENWSEKGHYP